MRLNEVALDMETFEVEKTKMEKILDSSVFNNHNMNNDDFKVIKLISKGVYGYGIMFLMIKYNDYSVSAYVYHSAKILLSTW